MKKIISIIAVILFVTILLTNQIVMAVNEKNAENKIISIWCIDTDLNKDVIIDKGLHIEGWKLATEKDTQIVVSIDGKKMDSKYIKYSRKYDLISIIKGYGTYAENPLPNFDIDIPKEELSVGNHRLRIECITSDGSKVIQMIEKQILITRDIKHVLNIDTILEGATFNKTGIEITGWKLATEANTKLVAKIDGKEIENTQIYTYYAYDLISIVKGYGTYAENPTPNFTIKIPTDTISQGKHKVEIQFLTSDNILLEKVEKQINIDKTIKHILNIDTRLDGVTFDKYGIKVTGWKLATEPNTKLVAKINGKEIENTQIYTYYAYDLISIVKGYGTYEENPTPNFTIEIPTDTLQTGKYKLTIQFVTADNKVLDTFEKEIKIDKSIKHILNLDTNLNNLTWGQKGIEITGWKLATEPNTTIVAYLNNKKVENAQIYTYYAYDLISIVKGYGTYEENPTPNFTLIIPVTEFQSGNNKLKLQMIEENGNVLEEVTATIPENRTRIHIEYPFDRNTIFNKRQSISGWMMTTVPNTTVKLLIDGYYRNETATRSARQDVLNAIQDCGNTQTNPLPGFDISVDFSQFSLGLHQIAIRIENEQGSIVGEEVIYIFLNRGITFEEGIYGVSGLAIKGDPRGSNLKYYRYGDGPNVFFATFAIHGFEDNWAHDGEALVKIANKFYEELKNNHSYDYELADKWTIYILPTLNPDGVYYGTDNNGPGRTTLYSAAPGHKGIDMNRAWKSSGFNANEKSRNYAGTAPFQAYEAQALRDFLISHKSQKGQTVLVDLHGWYQQLIGDRAIGMYYAVQFPNSNGSQLDRYGDGYLISWARTALASNGRAARTALIELPRAVYSQSDVDRQKLPDKYIWATLSMLHGLI